MALYSQGANTTVITTTTPSFDVKASSTNSPKVMEYGLNLGAATASTYGMGRPGNDGSVAQTAPVLLQAEDGNNTVAAQSGTAVAWGTAPTVPTVFIRRCYLPATIGAGIIWTFPRGLTLPSSKGLVNWNIAASSANTAFWIAADE